MTKSHLNREQGYKISLLYRLNFSQKNIAEEIGKDKSVINRELKRNANNKGKYSFEYAQYMANLRKERNKKPRKLHPLLKKRSLT